MMQKILNFFKKEDKKEVTRSQRELLRELLLSVNVDVFYHDDPLIGMSPEERKEYLQHFFVLARDEKLMKRLEFYINKQANVLLKNGTEADGKLDSSAIMTMNGITIVKNDIERLSGMFLKEEEERKYQMSAYERTAL